MNLITETVPSATDVLRDVRIVSPAPRETWRRVFLADPDAQPTQAPEWMDCLRTMHGYADASRLYELPDGRRLVLPLAARRIAGVGLVEESWPHGWGYGGVLVEGGAPTDADRSVVLNDLARRPVLRNAVVTNPLTATAWADVAPPGAHRVADHTQIVDLGGGFETVWTLRFRKQARRSVRKSENTPLEIRRECGSSVERGIEMFAALYGQAVDRWAAERGQPVWLARRLAARRDRPGAVAAAAAALGDRCVIWSATRNGEPVVVDVVLQHGRHSFCWLGAADPALARETMASYRMQAMEIEDACNAGVRYYNLGESEPGSGVERYKLHFGAQTVTYPALRYERLPLTAGERRLRAAFTAVSAMRARRTPRSGSQ